MLPRNKEVRYLQTTKYKKHSGTWYAENFKAVVGRPDEIKGQALVAFVTLKGSVKANASLREELRQHVGKEIGPVAKPDNIRFADALPKTRSGKIMRRLLKQIAAGNTQVQGDTSTLEDISVIAQLSKDEG